MLTGAGMRDGPLARGILARGMVTLLVSGLALAAPLAVAAELTGNCRLQLTSVGTGGEVVDAAELPGLRGTVGDPLRVPWEGSVEYSQLLPTALTRGIFRKFARRCVGTGTLGERS
ncbi:hypothetical protein BH23CHL7_BH23CHL7_05930 [soil metagenome]